MPNRPGQSGQPNRDTIDGGAVTSGDPRWLCRLEDIPEGGTRGLQPVGNDDRLLAVRTDAGLFVYVNNCPHQNRPLEYRRHRFLAPDGQSIMCYAHAARFCIRTGECFVGPCEGQALQPVAVDVVAGEVWLTQSVAD